MSLSGQSWACTEDVEDVRGKHDQKAQYVCLDEVVWKEIIGKVPCDTTGSEEERDENITVEVSRKRKRDEPNENEKRDRKKRLSLSLTRQ